MEKGCGVLFHFHVNVLINISKKNQRFLYIDFYAVDSKVEILYQFTEYLSHLRVSFGKEWPPATSAQCCWSLATKNEWSTITTCGSVGGSLAAKQGSPKLELHPNKVMLRAWGNCKGVIHGELPDANDTVTSDIYRTPLDCVEAVLRGKQDIFHHDNAHPHVANIHWNRSNHFWISD